MAVYFFSNPNEALTVVLVACRLMGGNLTAARDFLKSQGSFPELKGLLR